jgi:hypothetical protein
MESMRMPSGNIDVSFPADPDEEERIEIIFSIIKARIKENREEMVPQ